MLKQLSNPHLPKIYDIIENTENFMLVIDFIEGESLDKVIAREGPQSPERVCYWGMQICEVFDYLHKQPKPVIYRDMKPANLILKPDGTLMMIDFGTARTQKDDVVMAQDTTCIGTAGFAAPEQYGGSGQSTARTDIFCLGATLYNMIAGRMPSSIVGVPFENLNPLEADMPLADIIRKCTKSDPLERYQTAMELYEDLYLASTGAFRSPSKAKSGGLRKVEWQKQNFAGTGMISGALAGKIQRGKTETTPFREAHVTPAQEKASAENAVGTIWKEQAQQTQVGTEHYETQSFDQSEDIWHKVMMIGVLVAMIFLVLSVVLILCDQITAAIVFMMIALGAAALAVVGLIQTRRQP